MRHTLNKLETVSALALTIGNLTADEYPVWYSIYGEELRAEARAARESLLRESVYIAELIRASLTAASAKQHDELLLLAIKTLEG